MQIVQEHIIVTENTEAIREALTRSYDRLGIELVNSSPTSILWRWYNASTDALESIKGKPGYKGTIQVL